MAKQIPVTLSDDGRLMLEHIGCVQLRIQLRLDWVCENDREIVEGDDYGGWEGDRRGFGGGWAEVKIRVVEDMVGRGGWGCGCLARRREGKRRRAMRRVLVEVFKVETLIERSVAAQLSKLTLRSCL